MCELVVVCRFHVRLNPADVFFTLSLSLLGESLVISNDCRAKLPCSFVRIYVLNFRAIHIYSVEIWPSRAGRWPYSSPPGFSVTRVIQSTRLISEHRRLTDGRLNLPTSLCLTDLSTVPPVSTVKVGLRN